MSSIPKSSPGTNQLALVLSLCLLAATLSRAQGQALFTSVNMPPSASGVRGQAAGDYNNDGWPDLLRAEQFSTGLGMIDNRGDFRFVVRRGVVRGPAAIGARGGVASFGDIDNDGDLDAVAPGGIVRPDPNILLRNDDGRLSDVSAAAGLGHRLSTDNAIWVDYDRDGYVDLYTGDVGDVNHLYRNRGDGTFADVTDAVGLLGDRVGGNGGLSGGDFNGDGWPDLYSGVYGAPNHMSLSDGAGGFTNASTAELADEGQALGAAVGDIDNDGNLDLFQAAGGGGEGSFRSLLLLNLGDGQFLDVLESAGLDALANASPATAVFLDVDNDADLDLLIGFPLSLFLNDGRGLFTQATKRLGTTLSVTHMAVADFDRDGFLDVARPSQFLRNLGNANHWLQVDPVGVASNRCGIGTRLVVRSGDLRQVREIAGGNGWEQAEMIAHFGLGGRDRVDSLIVSWPSGQVDRFTDLAVDERIRVVEGRDTYGPAPPTVWAIDAPDAVTDGQAFAARISARVGLFEPEAAVVEAVADFGELGGGRVPLVAVGDDVFELTHELSVVATGGHKEVRVFIDQETSLGRRRTVLGHDVEVWPRTWPMADLPIYGDAGPSGRWEVVSGDVTITEPEGDAAEGARLARLELRSQRFKAAYVLDEPADVGGYQALGFASRPRGAATSIPFGVLYLTLNDEGAKALPLVGTHVSLGDTTEWRRTSVPLSRFWLDGPLTSIQIGGEVTGILEIDDLRLLPGRAPTITAVVESGDETVPESFTLSQNVPNPFNPHTTIRYQLPSAGEVELAVYNLAAQKVTTLALGLRDAGSYAIRWDGRDASGKELASGVYLYRLTAAGRTETRKLLLLR